MDGAADGARHANRNIVLLAGCQAIGGSTQAIVISVAALTGALLAPDPALATLPTTAMIVGLAVAAGPAAMLLHRLGRREGFMLGAGIGVLGGLAAAAAVIAASFWLFALSLVLVGVSAAFGQQYRFAVADGVPEPLKARAISLVMAGGVFAGVLGPLTATVAKDLVPGAEFAGSYFALAGLALIAIGILSQTRLPGATPRVAGAAQGRPTALLLRTPDVLVPILAAIASYALMTFVMVAAPLAMVYYCGHSTEEATGAIQWHIVAMFAPSFVTGAIIRRIGAHVVTGIGLALILLCAAIGLSGDSVPHFIAALVLLGVGWNFGFIGATTLLATSYRPEEAARVQALNEQLVFGAMAIASVGSGVLLELIGWQAINVMVLPLATAALALLAWADLRRRRRPA